MTAVRKWLLARVWWLFPLLVVAVGIWIVGSAKSFQQCIRDIKRQESQQSPKEGVSYLFVVLSRYKGCSGVFIIENRDSAIALGTLGLVIFTGTLWWSTRRLQQFAEIQSREMRRSIRISRLAALASARQARAAIRLAEDSREHVALVRASLHELQRAYIHLHRVQPRNIADILSPQATVGLVQPIYPIIRISLKNFGKTPGNVRSAGIFVDITDDLPPPWFRLSIRSLSCPVTMSKQ